MTEATTLAEIPYLRLFPWLRIFRCAGGATDRKRLLLAAMGLLIVLAGQALIHAGSSSLGKNDSHPDSWRVDGTIDGIEPLKMVAEPYTSVIRPVLLDFDPRGPLTSYLAKWLSGFWALVVWSIVGAAIARIAVIDLTKSERLGLGQGLRFALRKARSILGALLVPILGVTVVAVPVAVFGLLYRLGSVGSMAAGVLAFLPLLGGLVLAIVLLAPILGWPLMIASISTEDEDAFDAVSRTYGYVHQRPWHYAGYVLVAALVGWAGLTFVELFGRLVVGLTAWSLSLSAGDRIQPVFSLAPRPISEDTSLALQAHLFWLAAVSLLVRSWAYSFFWSCSAAIYLLLRRDVDGTPMTTVMIRGPRSASTSSVGDPKPTTTPGPVPASIVEAVKNSEV
jgi:hypothetical protein